MSLLLYLIGLALSGLFVGAFGRLALPGKDPMSVPQTIGIGLAGSFTAGLVVYLVSGGTSGAGLILAIAAATFFVYLVRRSRGGTLTEPAPRR
ncbi:MAG: hypothetical protein H0V81_09050 [Solirubrobacterales bacterium]|nr:hypothetical protein [Solirubrobacterales bacterium]